MTCFWRSILSVSAIMLLWTPWSAPALADNLTIPQLLERIKQNESKVKDMKATMTTTIYGGPQGSKPMVQKGTIWSKAPDKYKVELSTPFRQITITRGDKMKVIQPDSGQSFVQDLSKLEGYSGLPQRGQALEPSKIMEKLDLKIASQSSQEVVLEGTPKEGKETMGKLHIALDGERLIPTRVVLFNKEGKPMTESTLSYKQVGNAWIPHRNRSTVSLPSGTLVVEMTLDDIAVNQGILDSVFDI